MYDLKFTSYMQKQVLNAIFSKLAEITNYSL